MKRILGFLLLFNFLYVLGVFVFLPQSVEAAIVPCMKDDECTICDLQTLAMNIVNTLIVIGAMVATLLFVYAGILYVFSPANPGNIGKAHGIFKATLIGFIIILSGWLVVDLIMKTLYSGAAGGITADWNEILCKK